MRDDEAQASAALFSMCGSNDFGAALDRLSSTAAVFDMSSAFAFHADRSPVVIHDGYSATTNRKALNAYVRGAYLLDPFYSASVGNHAEGLWRMRDLAPDAFYEGGLSRSSEVYPCISDEAGTLVEEVGFIIDLENNISATFSIMRNRHGMPFSDEEFAALSALTPLVAVSLRRHWQLLNVSDDAATTRRHSEEIFRRAFSNLTPAQYLVTKLILRGHSNISIAENLGITEGTVKMHRYNIYKRLNISSQSELFQIFIDQLTE
ncbi:helix-turn-helix transcriptional regulator [Pseudochelatococcus contaminans]|uniref:DNA-binding CsgD family transcriptional regulator n=1 Tax=Pseudochelatococcus contaminans TaxID=1538103 RepID=A0A7W5Z4B6_9HYPH|nr:helix-turn-helix transcriptional regulator [Pseudochelatococcus contaminans]MBB3809935.1 DNA-binding CsgD family transcriptional regulator [Pseudochelatococcus contaminans]